MGQAELKAQLAVTPACILQLVVFAKLDAEPLLDNSNTAVRRARSDLAGDRLRLREAVMAAWTRFPRRGTLASTAAPE